jgi:hypothetical protein
MGSSPSVLIVTTQTWLQVTRLAARLVSRGCRVSVICPEESPLAFMTEVSGQFRFRLINPLGSLRYAIAACAADYVLPTDDFSVGLLHELAGDPRMVPLIERSLGQPSFYPLVHSRLRMLSLAHDLGISVPRTEPIRDAKDLDQWVADDESPFLLKKDGTWGGQGVRLVRTAAEAQEAFQMLSQAEGLSVRAATWLRNGNGSAFARLRCLQSPELTAQEFIEGIPANSMYACHEGKVLGEVQARVAASRGKTGPSIVIQLMQDARIHQAGVKLVEALHVSGFFGLDFILDGETGEPFLIECNPRATQLGHLSVGGQTDLASILWAQWAGENLPQPEDKRLGNAIWIYPDGQRLAEATASFPGCRPDAPPSEMEALERLIRESAPLRVRLRRDVWRSFSRSKGTLQWEERPQPFYYPQPQTSGTEPRDPREPRITVAS